MPRDISKAVTFLTKDRSPIEMNLRINLLSLNPVLDGLAPLRRDGTRFLFATAAVALALGLTAGSQWIFGSTSASIFALAVIFSTAVFGLMAGLCTAFAAVLVFDFFFLTPQFGFTLDTVTLRVAVALSAVAGCTHVLERRISASIRSKIKPPLGMHGNLDGIENGEVYGWASDADHPSQPVLVTVFVDHRLVANVAAVYYRPDVAEAMNCSGSHGFYFDLSPYVSASGETWIDVRLPNGVSLTNAPTVMRVPAIKPRKRRPTVLFMHIPKTAGTALREAIAANFVQSEIAYLYPSAPGFLVSDLRALPLEQRRALRVVIGHFQFGMHEALPQEAEYITVVREPSARVLSQYAYLLQTQPELITGSDGHVMDLPELFEKRLTVDFDNAIVRCFSGVDEREFPPGNLTRAIYEKAVYNLHTAFTFVGHQESSGESYEWLRRHYGWHATDGLPLANLGTVRMAKGPGAELMATIRHYNRWDCLLYEEILRKFPRTMPSSTRDATLPPDSTARHAAQG